MIPRVALDTLVEGEKRMILPEDALERKGIPIYSGVIRYFPDALVAVAKLSRRGNDQHNPGKPLHWDRSKSGDELDAMMGLHSQMKDGNKTAWTALNNIREILGNS